MKTSSNDGAADLLTSVEVASLLRVHPKHIYRLLARGLPGHRVGSTWRFDRNEVLAWSSGRDRTSPSGAESHATEASTKEGRASSPPSGPLPFLAANGDVAVELLLARVQSTGVLIGSIATDRTGALERLAEGVILAAGFHGEVPPSRLAGGRLARLHVVEREVGLASRKRLSSLSGLSGKRLASRPKTAGIRAHFDRALGDAGSSRRALGLRATEHASHRDAVLAAVRGEADVALTTSAWAERVGLAFMPLATETYDILIRAAHMGTEAAVRLCETLQTRSFRAELDAVSGYQTAHTGDIRYEPES